MFELISEQAFLRALPNGQLPFIIQRNSETQQLIVGWEVYDPKTRAKTSLLIKVYSSIFGPSGMGLSKGKGADSIRVCVVDTATSAGIGKQSYIQRTRGWEARLLDRITRAWDQAHEELRFRQTCTVGPAPDCPHCRSKMVLRKATKPDAIEKYAGKRFWGCSSFPACRKTLPFKPEPTDKIKTFKELSALRKQAAEWNP